MDPFLGAGSNTVSPKDESRDVENDKKGELLDVENGERGKKTKGLPHGIKPSQKEVEEHERTHLPFRSWCEHCVKGKQNHTLTSSKKMRKWEYRQYHGIIFT